MKILHLVPDLDPKKGGVGEAVRTLYVSLCRLGIQNEVISLDQPGGDGNALDEFLIHLKGPGRGHWYYSSSLLPFLVEQLSRFNVVIVHGLWLYHSYALRKAFVALQKGSDDQNTNRPLPKLFVMPHGMLDPYFQKASDRKLKAVRNWIYWKLIEEKLIQDADGLLFTCEMERQLAGTTFKSYKPRGEYVVGLGVEKPPVYSADMKQAFSRNYIFNEQPYLLFLSRIDVKKGVDLLLTSYKKLMADGNILPNLVIAGPGAETEYGSKMLAFVKAENLQDKVTFPGMLTGDAKWGAFYGCEAFVLPSHQENFGIAVVEALACAKPVLISNQVNIWPEIKKAGAGLVEGDTLGGTETLLRLWSGLRSNEKQEMGKRALTCFQNNFGVAPVARRFLNLFQGVEK